ncbi:MAG: penicillin acylase family protein [Bdellovibrionales bacterium]|nr:penicillin acylase family protein [Bdellovibrionales bacterium]
MARVSLFSTDGFPRKNWQGWLSSEEAPQEINPTSGFVHSANQRPVSRAGSSYLGWSYPEAFRGKRIVDFLKTQEVGFS